MTLKDIFGPVILPQTEHQYVPTESFIGRKNYPNEDKLYIRSKRIPSFFTKLSPTSTSLKDMLHRIPSQYTVQALQQTPSKFVNSATERAVRDAVYSDGYPKHPLTQHQEIVSKNKVSIKEEEFNLLVKDIKLVDDGITKLDSLLDKDAIQVLVDSNELKEEEVDDYKNEINKEKQKLLKDKNEIADKIIMLDISLHPERAQLNELHRGNELLSQLIKTFKSGDFMKGGGDEIEDALSRFAEPPHGDLEDDEYPIRSIIIENDDGDAIKTVYFESPILTTKDVMDKVKDKIDEDAMIKGEVLTTSLEGAEEVIGSSKIVTEKASYPISNILRTVRKKGESMLDSVRRITTKTQADETFSYKETPPGVKRYAKGKGLENIAKELYPEKSIVSKVQKGKKETIQPYGDVEISDPFDLHGAQVKVFTLKSGSKITKANGPFRINEDVWNDIGTGLLEGNEYMFDDEKDLDATIKNLSLIGMRAVGYESRLKRWASYAYFRSMEEGFDEGNRKDLLQEIKNEFESTMSIKDPTKMKTEFNKLFNKGGMNKLISLRKPMFTP